MRWYEVNSEQLDAITEALTAYHLRLRESMDSAAKAGLPRGYDLEKSRFQVVEQAMFHLADIRRSES